MQTCPADEIVVVDDGSTDGSGDALAHLHAPGLRLIRQENAGASGARNRGIHESTGDVIAFLDADDEWQPNFLEVIRRLSSHYPEAGAFATSYVFFRHDKQSGTEAPFSTLLASDGLLLRYFAAVAEGGMLLSSSSIAVRRSTFDAVGTFKAGVAWGEDTEMWARIYLQFPIAYSPERLARYHVVAPNRAGARTEPRPLMPVVQTLARALEDGQIRAEEVPSVIRCICNSIEFTVKANIYLGYRDLAGEQLRSLWLYPCSRKAYWLFRILTLVPHGCLLAGVGAKRSARRALDALSHGCFLGRRRAAIS